MLLVICHKEPTTSLNIIYYMSHRTDKSIHLYTSIFKSNFWFCTQTNSLNSYFMLFSPIIKILANAFLVTDFSPYTYTPCHIVKLWLYFNIIQLKIPFFFTISLPFFLLCSRAIGCSILILATQEMAIYFVIDSSI